MIRIASAHKEFLAAFTKHHPGSTALEMPSGELCARLGEADLFLLTDEEAMGIANHCETESRPTLVVIAREGEPLPISYAEGFADDLLLFPLRALDCDRILRSHEQMQVLKAVEHTSRAVPELVRKLSEDVQLAQKIQRRLIKEKFPPMGGLNVKSKYWCGLKAGGDYFDVFEFPDGNHVGLILSDSSSYSLSTSFIGSLMQFSVHVTQDDLGDPAKIVSSLYGKLKDSMKEKDHFSIFYGILDRKTYQLKYVDCGNVFAASRNAGGELQWIASGENPALSVTHGLVIPSREILLEPGDRMMLVSDGWADSMAANSRTLLERFIGESEDPQDILNSMAFSLRKGVEKLYELDEEEEFPMPPQDCSVLLFDLAKNVLRLAK